MISEKQLAANRANAKKSTGPRTPEGKATSSRNGVIHSISAHGIAMTGESPRLFTAHVTRMVAELQPRTHVELELVHRAAVATWRQKRLWAIETAAYSMEVENQIAASPGAQERDPARQAAAAYRSMGDQTHFQSHLSRDESRLDRQYYKALRELRERKKEKNPNPFSLREAALKHSSQTADLSPSEV